MHTVECPYCEADNKINHDDGFGYDENELHELCCSECDKNFVFSTIIIFHFESHKADCLNDGEHQWEEQRAYPKEYTQMRCSACGEMRKPTEAEWAKILK